MKILIDIGHPAHVHYFRNLYKILTNKGDKVLVVSREKDVAINLLKEFGIPFINRGRGSNSTLGKLLYMIRADLWLLAKAMMFKPDLMLSFSTIYPAHVSFILRIPYLGITDTEHSVEQQRLFVPFSKYILTPTCFRRDFGKKHFRFNSYMELSYLHPKYFTPDNTVLKDLNITDGEKYSIIRFVSWNASHDRGHLGISYKNKIRIVNELSEYGKVFISSEEKLPNDLNKHIFPLDASKLHHAMYYANLVYGESATMASEAAILGTPAIFHDDDGRGYTFEQEEIYGHVHNFTESEEDQELGIKKAVEIISDSSYKEEARKCSLRILNDKISTTDFLVEFINDNFMIESNK